MKPDTAPSGGTPPLSIGILGAYSAPAFSQSFLMGPAISVLQGIYAKFFGLGLEQIALVLMAARIFNGLSDPAIGFLSDAYRARRGTRKPWLIAGSFVAVVACWFLYVPFGRVTTFTFLFWFLLADIGWSMCAVPYAAWMAELTDDYGQRARIAGWRAMGTYAGMLAFFGMPLALGRFLGSTEFTPTTLRWAAVFAAITLPLTTLLATVFVPNGAAPVARHANPFRGAARAVVRNRPLWMFIVMFAIGGLGGGMGWGLVYFYIDGYLHLGSQLSGLLVLSLPTAILATPVWSSLCRRFSKQAVWAAGYGGAGLASLLYLVIRPGTFAALLLGFALLFLNAMVVVEGVAAPAVLADIVDYGRWRFGTDQSGTYFALFGMITKINSGIGAAIGLAVAGVLGFDARAATQTSGGLFGLLFAFAAMPAACYAISALLVLRFPINRRRQRVLVKAIERRTARERRAAEAVSGAAP